jgi:chromosome segregation ATPase
MMTREQWRRHLISLNANGKANAAYEITNDLGELEKEIEYSRECLKAIATRWGEVAAERDVSRVQLAEAKSAIARKDTALRELADAALAFWGNMGTGHSPYESALLDAINAARKEAGT